MRPSEPEPRESSDERRVVVRADAWLEYDGRLWVGAGRAALLEAVQRTGSISGAARACGMSYRRGWSLIARMNEVARAPLVETQTGGTRGGGARLTEAGEGAVRLFRRMEELLARFHEEAGAQLDAELGARLGAADEP